jgi:superoxide dismutase
MRKLTLLLLVLGLTGNLMAQFSLPQLPYAYNALEPVIDAQTMEIHHSKHHAAYVNNLNNALKGNAGSELSIDDINKNISKYSMAVRNNGGGHFNHSLFWSILSAEKNTMPNAGLRKAIEKQFTSVDSLKKLINTAASTRFGSGWAWLIVTPEYKLAVCSTPNQDNPLMDIAEVKGTPILGIDVWEHAYYLKYQNKRPDYLTAIWSVINWNEVSKRYDAAMPPKKSIWEQWPSLNSFHGVMAGTFHPSEEGNLKPIKARSGEMVTKAQSLMVEAIPEDFSTPEIKDALTRLIAGSKELDTLVKKKSKDAILTQKLTALHDVFHEIVGLCKDNH